MTTSAARDWIAWHARYDDPDSSQSRRLAVVQRHIGDALARGTDGGVIRVISMCAGDGRDLLGVLADHPARDRVRARLVELDPALAARARDAATAAGLGGIEVVVADAGRIDAYAGAVPADLVLVCGVFGNIGQADIRRTVEALPSLCAERATVIWARHREPPDLTPTIRDWFTAAGFEELAFDEITDSSASVGVARLTIPPSPFRAGRPLFRFAA